MELSNELDLWVKKLYADTRVEYEKIDNGNQGFAIFYSPVKANPELMIIGLNPGLGVKCLNRPMESPLDKHDYFEQNYPIARNMKKIFEGEKMEEKLRESVKLNLYFFRSRNWSSLNISMDAKNYCQLKTIEIIERLQPKVLIAEGFKTYEDLINLFPTINYHYKDIFCKTGKRIIRKCNIKNEKIVIGITHPSATRGITTACLIEIRDHIKSLI